MAGKPNPEQERLMRLRERQLSTRDPHVKTRNFQQHAAERERRRDSGLSPGEIWGVIPHIWKSGFSGLLIGLLLLAVVTKLWISPLATPVMIAVTVICTLLGIVIGRALDLRDEIKRHAR
jgi:hypothetical protein